MSSFAKSDGRWTTIIHTHTHTYIHTYIYIRLVHLPTHFDNELMFFLCVTLYTRKSKWTKILFFGVIFRSPQASKYLHVNCTTHNLCEYSPSLQLPCFTIEDCYRTAYHNNINEVQFNSTHSLFVRVLYNYKPITLFQLQLYERQVWNFN